jgi:hypothetical protein
MEDASGSINQAGVDDWDMLNVEDTQLVSAVKRAMYLLRISESRVVSSSLVILVRSTM